MLSKVSSHSEYGIVMGAVPGTSMMNCSRVGVAGWLYERQHRRSGITLGEWGYRAVIPNAQVRGGLWQLRVDTASASVLDRCNETGPLYAVRNRA